MATTRRVAPALVRAAANNGLVRGALQEAVRTGGSGNPGLLGDVFTHVRRIAEAAGVQIPNAALPPASRRSSSSSRPTVRPPAGVNIGIGGTRTDPIVTINGVQTQGPMIQAPAPKTQGPMIQAPAPKPTGGDVFTPITRRPIANQFDVGAGIQGAIGAKVGGGSTVDVILAGVGAALADGGGSEVPSGSNLVPGATGGGNCPSGTISIFGKCIDVQPGGATAGAGLVVGGGEAVHGYYGVGVAPAQRSIAVRDCPAGMVLGKDGICYNRAQLRKSERAHPPARKPLMTGGDLNAISRASSVARKLKRKNKELRKLGLL